MDGVVKTSEAPLNWVSGEQEVGQDVGAVCTQGVPPQEQHQCQEEHGVQHLPQQCSPEDPSLKKGVPYGRQVLTDVKGDGVLWVSDVRLDVLVHGGPEESMLAAAKSASNVSPSSDIKI